MQGASQVTEHEIHERIARLETDQRWTRRELEVIRQRLDEIAEMIRRHNVRDGSLGWKAIAQLSAAVAGLVGVVSYLVQRLG